jgi:hypothetical protein
MHSIHILICEVSLFQSNNLRIGHLYCFFTVGTHLIRLACSRNNGARMWWPTETWRPHYKHAAVLVVCWRECASLRQGCPYFKNHNIAPSPGNPVPGIFALIYMNKVRVRIWQNPHGGIHVLSRFINLYPPVQQVYYNVTIIICILGWFW